MRPALLEAAPGRMLWGTDWPHSGYFDAARMPDDVALADLCAEFTPDAALRHELLVDKPDASVLVPMTRIWRHAEHA